MKEDKKDHGPSKNKRMSRRATGKIKSQRKIRQKEDVRGRVGVHVTHPSTHKISEHYSRNQSAHILTVRQTHTLTHS